MKLTPRPKDRSVSFDVPRAVYGRPALEVVAQVFAGRAEVLLEQTAKAFRLTLVAARKDAGAPELEALAGEFLNELLNQEYRFVVAGVNRKVSGLIVTQTLFSARGGETPPAAPEAESSPEFQAEVAALLKETEEEIARTMPKKLPPQAAPQQPSEAALPVLSRVPQGNPLPPEKP